MMLAPLKDIFEQMRGEKLTETAAPLVYLDSLRGMDVIS